MFIGLKVVLSVSGDMLFENEQCVRQQKVEEITKGNETRAVWMERQRWKLRGRLARRAAPIRSIVGFKVVEKAEPGF